jgi:hypothetical protein
MRVVPIFMPTPVTLPVRTLETPVIAAPSTTSWGNLPPLETPTPLISVDSTAVFKVRLDDNEPTCTASLLDGTLIYSGSDRKELCRNVNQTLKIHGLTAARIEVDGRTLIKQDAFAATVELVFETINPEVELSVLLSSPGASLVESSTESEFVPAEGRFRSLLKIKRQGQTASIAVFHATKERLGHFMTLLRGRMSADLKHMSVERLIKKARTDFERNYPGPEIKVRFTSESGATEWVRITPLQTLRELWMRS